MACSLQPCAQLEVVIDLAVEQDGDVAALVPDRLLTPRNVDDAQAAKGEPRIAENGFAGLIGTTVGDRLSHPNEHFWIGPDPNDTGDSTHCLRGQPGGGRLYGAGVSDRLPRDRCESSQRVPCVHDPGGVRCHQ